MFQIVRNEPHDVPTLPRPTCGKGSYPAWGMLGFDSRHEAVLAQLLCRYVEPFWVERGVTWQVEAGGRYIDFRVGDAFVEYHPVRIKLAIPGDGSYRGPFPSRAEHERYGEVFRALPVEEQELFRLSAERELKDRYVRERTELIEAKLPASKCIFAHNPEEFYLKVLVPYGSELPALREFKQMFSAMLKFYEYRSRFRVTPTTWIVRS